jgi:hypothetical protein
MRELGRDVALAIEMRLGSKYGQRPQIGDVAVRVDRRMDRKALDEFIDRILPFYGLWQSVRVSGAAVSVNGGWFNVDLQLEMCEEKPEAQASFLIPPDFLHFRFEYPICELRNLILDTIQNGFFTLGTDDHPETNIRVFLSRNASNSADAAARMAWFGPRVVQPENMATGPASRAWVNLTARGDRLDELASYGVLRSSRLGGGSRSCPGWYGDSSDPWPGAVLPI